MKEDPKIKEAAQKIYDFFAPWDIENATPAEIAEEIKKNPIDAILFLLDCLENQ